ncbi:hypothetical protein Tco_1317870 [Tanacetum coccineum]
MNEQAVSCDDEVGRDHFPTVNEAELVETLTEDRPAHSEPACDYSSSHLSMQHNWALLLEVDISFLHRRNSLLSNGDMATLWIGTHSAKPSSMGGEKACIHSTGFFFNKGPVEYLRYGRKCLISSRLQEECKYDMQLYGILIVVYQRQRFYIDRFSSEGDRRALNLTKPRWEATGFEFKHDYIQFMDFQGQLHSKHRYGDRFRLIIEGLIRDGTPDFGWRRCLLDRSKGLHVRYPEKAKYEHIFRKSESFWVDGSEKAGNHRFLEEPMRGTCSYDTPEPEGFFPGTSIVSVEVLRSVLTDPEDQAKMEMETPRSSEVNSLPMLTLITFQGNPQMDLQDQGVIDSGCSRHMTENMSYLINYEEIDGGYVTFGGNSKGGKITGKDTKSIQSDYAGESLDRKSTIRGCQFLGCRLISWQYKKQIVVANSTTEAEYVAASSCCRQVRWIQNQLLDYRDCNEKKLIQMVKIHTDKNVADLLTKAFDVRKAKKNVKLMMEKLFRMELELMLAKNINGEEQLHALVDGKKIIITESSVRRDLQLVNEEGGWFPRVLDLEKTKNTQDNEIASLKRRVKKLEKTNRGAFDAIDADEKFTLVSVLALEGNEKYSNQERKGLLYKRWVNLTKISSQLSSQQSQNKGKGIMIEHVKPMKKKDQISLDEETALNLQAEFDEEERLAREKLEKRKRKSKYCLIETWDYLQARLMLIHQLAEECKHKNKKSYLLRKRLIIFTTLREKVVRHFDSLKVQKRKETILQQKSKERLYEEEVAIDAIPLAVKSPSIVGWKIYKEGRKSYYQIMRADGKSQTYMIFSHMLKGFDKEDLENLYKLVKAKYESTRPVEDLDLILWGDLKTMFEPHIEDKVWKNQQDYKVLNWKLYDSCGVHSLRMQHVQIYMLVEKKYPLTPSTLTMMLEKKLMIDYKSEMAY